MPPRPLPLRGERRPVAFTPVHPVRAQVGEGVRPRGARVVPARAVRGLLGPDRKRWSGPHSGHSGQEQELSSRRFPGSVVAGLPNPGTALGVQNAEYADNVTGEEIEDREGEAVDESPAELSADEGIGFRIPGNPVKGGADAEAKLGFQARPCCFVPSDSRGQVTPCRILDDDTAFHSVASQASTSSQGNPGGISPRSEASNLRLSSASWASVTGTASG